MEKKIRLTVDLTEKTEKNLDELVKELSTTKVEAIRRAISFMAYCFEQKKIGYDFWLKNESKKKKKQIMII